MLIKLGITLIRIQRERWIETEEGDGDTERESEWWKAIRENENWQSHSSSEPYSCLSRPVTCSEMTHALTGWMCLDASHMKHKRESSL